MTMTVDNPSTSGAADMSALVATLDRQRRLARRRTRAIIIAARVLLLVIVLVAWQLLSGDPADGGTVMIDEFYISQPTTIFEQLRSWIESGDLQSNIWITLIETAFGFAVGAVLGVFVGFATGVNTWVSAVLTPYITALYSVPRLAIAPLFILWFGLDISSKVAFVAMIVFFLVFFNTYSGVRDVDDDLIDVLRIMKPGRLHIYRRVILPSAGVWIMTGLRISAPYALVGAVTSEMISSNRGMGFLLIRASGQLNTGGVFAAIFVMMILALLITALVALLERRVLRWRRPA
jgi:NitT/TauT family transport system permease protein